MPITLRLLSIERIIHLVDREIILIGLSLQLQIRRIRLLLRLIIITGSYTGTYTTENRADPA